MNACSEPAPCPTCTVVDTSIFVFRAWFARGLDPDPQGRPGGALHGFVHSLCQWLPQRAPGPLGFCFDTSLRRGFRHRLDPGYKAHRPPAPPELRAQFERIGELLDALGLARFSHPEYEADDLIATLARNARTAGLPVAVMSADKDLAQTILGDRDHLHDPERGRPMDRRALEKRLRVRPDQVADLLALAGDRSDNIPGIHGLGPRGAARILRRLGDLESVLADPDAVRRCNLRRATALAQAIAADPERLRLSRRLTGLVDHVPGLPRGSDLLAELQPRGPVRDIYVRLHDLGVHPDYHERLLHAAAPTPEAIPA
ncbi:5'-3' exonuclease H3TH domain-containing protein [Thioalkalivibrio sp. ALE23]|uniref:5'-3' exonuclease n=1 Tax=Thioalkalivibrio sp. ALE23 TaxID=1265495 RepID=UPI000372AC9E|nr:5'-3' exonuclease H3TH domain-containing protein [Thioalkalivibrio sp. ALE23]